MPERNPFFYGPFRLGFCATSNVHVFTAAAGAVKEHPASFFVVVAVFLTVSSSSFRDCVYSSTFHDCVCVCVSVSVQVKLLLHKN